jgi:methyl-accepting chemotaxis protein
MSLANKVRIGGRLRLAFGGLFLALALVGGIGLYQAARLSDAASDLADNRMPSIVALGRLAEATMRFREAQAAAILSTNAATSASVAQSRSAVLADIDSFAENGYRSTVKKRAAASLSPAGDAGKGIAVVASEVKNLATQTAKATDDISRHISQIQTATKEAVTSIQGIDGTIAEISEIAAAIAAAVEEQGSATQEIARNVQQAAAGTHEVSSNIVGVSQGASESGAAANQVLGTAGELSRQAEQLRNEVNLYIIGVKAA